MQVNEEPSGPSKQPASFHPHYVLTMVFIGFALNLFDRQIIGILLQPIKQEFHLSDTALGLLSGLAFALFYATLGIPIARLADRRSRRLIMTVSMALWSAMTALGGLAQNAVQLVLSRVGVGVGEAGFTPAAISLLADYYPKSKRILAMSVVNLGPVAGIMLGLMVGGWAAEALGWRGALLLAGAPGVVFALLFWCTVREPLRGRFDGATISSTQAGRAGAVVPAVPSPWRVPSYRWIVLGASFFSFGVFGASTWLPAMLERSYGVGPAAAGMMLGPLFGVAGAAGTLFGGWAAQVLARRDARWALWLPALAAVLCVPLVIAAFLSHVLYATVGLYAVAYGLSFIYMGPVFATVQTLVAPHGRATATAWMMFCVNLIGIGLGPQLVGVLSDLFNTAGTAEPLRYALAAVAVFFVVPAIAFVRAARTLVADAENTKLRAFDSGPV